MSKTFPFYKQHDAMDCGAACLRMIAKYYGKHYSLESLREKTYITREGVSMLGISDAAENIGFRTLGVHVSFEKLLEAPLPCIVHWRQEHFVVVYDIKLQKSRTQNAERRTHDEGVLPSAFVPSASKPCGFVRVADPGHGLVTLTIEEFCNNWLSMKKDGGQISLTSNY